MIVRVLYTFLKQVSDVMLTPTQCIELLDYENTSIMSNLKKIVISGHVLHKDFVESLWKKFPGKNTFHKCRN